MFRISRTLFWNSPYDIVLEWNMMCCTLCILPYRCMDQKMECPVVIFHKHCISMNKNNNILGLSRHIPWSIKIKQWNIYFPPWLTICFWLTICIHLPSFPLAILRSPTKIDKSKSWSEILPTFRRCDVHLLKVTS